MMKIEFTLNRKPVKLETKPNRTLVDLLREDLELMGTKVNCRIGECGTCTVLLDGQNVHSCLTLVPQIAGRRIETIEGLATDGELHPVQQAFIDHHGFQCGYCTPGMILSAVALLRDRPQPTEAEIREGLVGNLCRCTGYHQIFESVRAAADQQAPGESSSS